MNPGSLIASFVLPILLVFIVLLVLGGLAAWLITSLIQPTRKKPPGGQKGDLVEVFRLHRERNSKAICLETGRRIYRSRSEMTVNQADQLSIVLGELLVWLGKPDLVQRAVEVQGSATPPQPVLAAEQIIGRKLDRAKPRWELHVITGFDNGKSALLFKVHHYMVDGISAIELFTLVLDISPEQPIIEEKPLYDPPRSPDEQQMLEDTIKRAASHRLKLLMRMGTTAFNLGVNVLEREQRKKTLTGIVSLINDSLTAIKPLVINGNNSGELAVAWSEFPMREVLDIRQKRRVSVNDGHRWKSGI